MPEHEEISDRRMFWQMSAGGLFFLAGGLFMGLTLEGQDRAVGFLAAPFGLAILATAFLFTREEEPSTAFTAAWGAVVWLGFASAGVACALFPDALVSTYRSSSPGWIRFTGIVVLALCIVLPAYAIWRTIKERRQRQTTPPARP